MSSEFDEDIFAQAIELEDASEQEMFVTAKCNGALERAQRILELLKSHRQLNSPGYSSVFSRQADVLSTLLPADDEVLGSTIGSYQVLRKLGEGGMGIVYLAEQLEPVRRQVALKVLKPGMDSQKVLARFELERQVLASMNHPGITRILDAGLTATSRPYFAMELVEGSPITTYSNSQAASPEFRLQLMLQLCSAIQHAHSRGVIHRDIKPSNILVSQIDDQPVVKVIDFGIAKAINDSFGANEYLTQHAEMIGTPAYMSPEQSQTGPQHVDVCTDVYSLGVVLYELLTGTTPHANELSQRSPFIAISALLREGEVELPSRRIIQAHGSGRLIPLPAPWNVLKLQRYLTGELDCIVGKALAYDRSQRYQSALELQRDIRRFLDDQPIEAVPPNWLYSARKFYARHRALATVAALASVLVVTASIAALIFGIMATRSQQLANQQLQKVLDIQSELVSQRDRAVESERRARLLAQFYLGPSITMAAINRFCTNFYEEMRQVNPELKNVPLDLDDPDSGANIFLTISASNLLPPDERIIVYDDFLWLVSLISDVSNHDVDSIFGDLSSSKEPEDTLESEMVPRELDYRFKPEIRRTFLNYILEEIHKIPDHDIPLLADTEECLGYCALDLGELRNAQSHFEEALRVRRTLPKQRLQTLQAQLLVADCLKRQQQNSEAIATATEIRAELATMTEHPKSVKRLIEFADSIIAAP